MSIVQTVLVFVGIPGAIISAIAFAVYGRSMVHQPNRYRPGQPWPYSAAWFVPHPDAVVHADAGAGSRAQIEAASTASTAPTAATTAVGGASGEW